MTRWLIVLTLSVAGATASGQRPVPSIQAGEPALPTTTTDALAAAARAAERIVERYGVRQRQLGKQYQDELEAIDRLKNQRPSWRRDRELRDSLSASLETANQLSTATRDLEHARIDLARKRRAYLDAIDAELSTGGAMVRAIQLKRARALLAPQVKDAPRHIVLPDLEVDPLADPEELDQRSAELRESEDELTHQLAALAAQAAELDRLAQLRKQHDRAGDLVTRDDDLPHRGAAHKVTDATDEVTQGNTPASPPVAPDSYVPIVLSEVIDASTMSSLAAAQHSGDPAQRAEAARRAHDLVARRLDEVRKRRAEIEARAHALRSKRS
jgi:hypothetical protein